MGCDTAADRNTEEHNRDLPLAMGVAQEMGMLKEGDLCVQTAGTLAGVSGSTDLIKVGIVSAVLGRGTGFGTGSSAARSGSPDQRRL